jgi:lysozyme family protein
MYNIKSNSIFIKQIFLLCLILFSFVPCTIKEYFANSFEINYQKPINKNRATNTALTFCQYTDTASLSKLTTQKKIVDDQLSTSVFIEFNAATLASKITSIKHNQNYSGNSPPQYILYKRMKILLT